MAAPTLKMFVTINIPDTVQDNIVYKEEESIVILQGRDLVHQWRSERYIMSESVGHKLVKAVIQGGKVAVFTLLRTSGFPMHYSDLIYLACQFGHLSLVKDIMNTGIVDVDKVTKYGWTPLEIAAVNGRTEVVRLLVKTYKADINLDRQFTPLENAIEGGHLDTVKEMVELKAGYSKGILMGRIEYLESSAKLVFHQEELINRGNEYKDISDFLLQRGMSVM